jgi:hypothetical protein
MGTAGIKSGGNHDHHRRFDGLLAYWLICTSGTHNPICEEHSKINLKNKIKSAIDYKNSKLVLLKRKYFHILWILYSSTKQIIIIEN